MYFMFFNLHVPARFLPPVSIRPFPPAQGLPSLSPPSASFRSHFHVLCLCRLRFVATPPALKFAFVYILLLRRLVVLGGVM